MSSFDVVFISDESILQRYHIIDRLSHLSRLSPSPSLHLQTVMSLYEAAKVHQNQADSVLQTSPGPTTTT